MSRFWTVVHVLVQAIGIPAGLGILHGGATPAPPAPTPAKPPAMHQVVPDAPRYLVAELSGHDEVSSAGKVAVGAPSGGGQAVLRLEGDRLTFLLRWHGISAPTMGHVHQGAAGASGPVVQALFGTTLPTGVTAVSGEVPVPDPALRDRLRTDPGSFYVNLHSAQFPSGAVRGQLRPLGAVLTPAARLSIDHLLPERPTIGASLEADLAGANEVPTPGGPAVGDPAARARAWIHLAGTTVDYRFTWSGLAPTMGHVHSGAKGSSGPVAVPLFGTALPPSLTGAAGTVAHVDAGLVEKIRKNPAGFYVNLHSERFPGGAVRGQL